MNEMLYIILPLCNPRQYKRRFYLYTNFVKRLLKDYENIFILTVEMIFNNHKSHTLSSLNLDDNRHKIIYVHSDSELWVKENLINIGIRYLTLNINPNWKYVAWIDCDIMFLDDDKKLIEKTIYALSHHPIVQMWISCAFLGPNNKIIESYTSYGFQYDQESDIFIQKVKNDKYLNKYYHPGFAYSIRRDFYDASGGLIDFCICGSADYVMVNACCNKVEKTFFTGMNEDYKRLLLQWQENIKPFHYKLGYVEMSICHFWHGSRKNRRYSERNDILLKNEYNPLTDIKKNSYGLVVLNNNKINLIKQLQHYFKNRNEDSIDE